MLYLRAFRFGNVGAPLARQGVFMPERRSAYRFCLDLHPTEQYFYFVGCRCEVHNLADIFRLIL